MYGSLGFCASVFRSSVPVYKCFRERPKIGLLNSFKFLNLSMIHEPAMVGRTFYLGHLYN